MKTTEINEIEKVVASIEEALESLNGFNPFLEDELLMHINFLESMNILEATRLANEILIRKVARLKKIVLHYQHFNSFKIAWRDLFSSAFYKEYF